MTNTDIKMIYNNYLKGVIPSNFELNRDILFDTSINDLLVGFCFEKSGFHKESLYVWAFVMPLYLEKDDLSLTFGHRLRSNKNGELWHLKNNPKIDNAVKELSFLMRNEIKMFLSKVTSANDFYRRFKNKEVKNIRIKEALVYSAIYAEDKKSKKLVQKFIDELENEDLDIGWIRGVLKNAINLKELLAKDDNVISQLKKNIELTKANLKIPPASARL